MTSETDTRSSVRIELDDGGSVDAPAPAPLGPAGGAQPVALIALVVALAAGFVGLVAISGDPAPPPPAPEDERALTPEPPEVDPLVWRGEAPQFDLLFDAIDGWYGVADETLWFATDPGAWEPVDLGSDSSSIGSPRVLDAQSAGDAVAVLLAAPNASPAGGTAVRTVVSSDGVVWAARERDFLPGEVVSGSMFQSNWVVETSASDGTRSLWTAPDGRLQPLELGRLAPRSWVATADGALVVGMPDNPDFPGLVHASVEGTRPAGVGVVVEPDAVLRRTGDGRVWLQSLKTLVVSAAPYENWEPAGAFPAGTTVRVGPRGDGVVGFDETGSPLLFADRFGTLNLRAAGIDGLEDGSNIELLWVDDVTVVVSGEVRGIRRIRVIALAGVNPRPLIRSVVVSRGQWDVPVLAPDRTGTGFVGLNNSNGPISFFESADGLAWGPRSETDLPSGFFAQRLVRTPTGWMAVGRLGVLDGAAFESEDGVSWTRIEIDLPRGATSLEIDEVSRSADATAVLGALGWPDDLSRTERFLLWWTDGGEPVDVPLRPCPESQGLCTIASIAVVADGVIVTHLADQRFTLSRWRAGGAGWSQIPVEQPLPLTLPTVRRSIDGVHYVGTNSVRRLDDGGTWVTTNPGPVAPGGILGWSDDGSVIVSGGDRSLTIGDGTRSATYELGGERFGPVLAVIDDAAIVRAVDAAGPALARLELPTDAPEGEAPPEALERAIDVDPTSGARWWTVFDERLQESSDLREWEPVPAEFVGAGRVLDLSRTDDAVTLLLATAGVTREGIDGTWISVSKFSTGRWEWLSTASVPHEVTSGSLNGIEWVVSSGPPLTTGEIGTALQLVSDLSASLWVGSATSITAQRVPTGASELAFDAISTGTGTLYLSIDLDFFNGSPPSVQLKRWEPDIGVTIVRPGGRSATEDDHLWLSGDNVANLLRDGEVWSASAPYDALALAGRGTNRSVTRR